MYGRAGREWNVYLCLVLLSKDLYNVIPKNCLSRCKNKYVFPKSQRCKRHATDPLSCPDYRCWYPNYEKRDCYSKPNRNHRNDCNLHSNLYGSSSSSVRGARYAMNATAQTSTSGLRPVNFILTSLNIALGEVSH